MSEPRYNLRRTPAPSRGAEGLRAVSHGKAPKTTPARGDKRVAKEAVAHKEASRRGTKKQKVRAVKSAKAKRPRGGPGAHKISELRPELSSEDSSNQLPVSEIGSDGKDDSSSEDDTGGEDEEEEEEEEYDPLLSMAKDAIISLTPTIIKDVLKLSSSAKDAMLRLGRGPLWGGMISGSGGARKSPAKRRNIDHVLVDIDSKGSPIIRASLGEGGGVAAKNIQDRSGYRDGFEGARWEEVEPIRRNLSGDLTAAGTSLGTRGKKKAKTGGRRTAEEIATMKSNFMHAVVFWIFLYLAYSNNRVRHGVYGTFNSLTAHPVLQNILGSATSTLHTAVTPIAETGIQLFTPRKALLEGRVRTSSAVAAAASLDLEKIILASQVFANLTRPIVIGLIAGELANARPQWALDDIRAKTYDFSASFEDAYEDLRVLTEAFMSTIRRVRDRYTLLANVLWDQASAEMLPWLRLGGRNQEMLQARGQRNKYSGFTVQWKYKIVRSALLREFSRLRTLSQKAAKSASVAVEKIVEARDPEVVVIEKVVEIAEPLVAGLEALDEEVYRIVMLFLHQEFVVEDYVRWVNLDELLLKGKLEALFSALGRLNALERLRGASKEG